MGESAGTAGTSPRLQTMPARIHDMQWILLAGFAALFALGTVMLLKKPAPLAAAPAAVSTVAPMARGPEGQAAAAAAEVNRAVHQGLDEIKDTLFRLELRRQAGTISEEDYAQQRARAEQTIRELVKG